MTGAEMIAAERTRQIEVEGYTAVHDNEHVENEFCEAADCYIEAAMHERLYEDVPPPWWPWAQEAWKPASPIRMLVKAGALIAAEVDRRLRAGETA